ncbi:MAG TPA: hypothetical protein PKA46_00455 [Ferruginibacter sp.]|nr:hypothetical protein [Ferruginibacter sp.]
MKNLYIEPAENCKRNSRLYDLITYLAVVSAAAGAVVSAAAGAVVSAAGATTVSTTGVSSVAGVSEEEQAAKAAAIAKTKSTFFIVLSFYL